ncbi:hypothetical protein W97_00528 [Coniosporium apollinis CBS 100218]|uniref:N-terminal nucleophile aminohydrolase n=1 Tax=Coniosporium apollinis (strain CBS 100218) TaxID=1168221 RepID=R7YHD1_CONA1|nr:uncharacterized protein W97_00528 [Coniosporium apollinis CBS 100218]EON61315.1 hypothetical protein W97_00528 [Coniosporium apollinis CBS 100218]
MIARGRRGGDVPVIFVHAGAGYHSVQNEGVHLQACNDAAKAAMAVLNNGGTAVDACEMAIKVLEDREITNAGYGSNLAMDGVVECDAVVVDHLGRSGGVGAVAQIKNPISLARLVLDHSSKQLTLRRVPPNLLVGQGAVDFAFDQGMPVMPYDALVSPAARERWIRWRSDLKYAERKARKAAGESALVVSLRTDTDPAFEEQTRNRMRREHTQMLLGNGFARASSVSSSPIPSHRGLDSSPSKTTLGSASATPDSASSCPSDQQEYIDPNGPLLPVQESSRSCFVNSTQHVPTLATLNSAQDMADDAKSEEFDDSDVQMSDVGDSFDPSWLERRQRGRDWNDGSSGEESSASDGTLHLPSVTSSPPPIAVHTPLPGTPPESLLEQPSPRASTPLGHVTASPPLPPSPLLSKLRKITTPDSYFPGQNEDHITDTVGAVAIDCYGNIACGASSGGIGMKYRGRVGPAALVGVGAAVVPMDPSDKQKTCVGVVTSGTGEHMATTMAATVCAERVYQGTKRIKGGMFEAAEDDEALRAMIEQEFMGHPSVKNSHSVGAIGLLAVKKTRDGVYLYFGHNTDSFAMASMHADEVHPTCTMSRSRGNGQIAQGGRAIRYRRKK